MKDVASAVAEVVTSLPVVPVRPDTPTKYTEVIGTFISELLKVKLIELLIIHYNIKLVFSSYIANIRLQYIIMSTLVLS